MFEKKSARNKLCPNQMFFTPLESSKILDIKNDHAFFIWGYELKVKTKRKN